MREKCKSCIVCGRPPQKGRVCEKCRSIKRKEYFKQRYIRYGRSCKHSAGHYKSKAKLLRNGRKPFCDICGWDKATEVLEVHHIDIDRSNNSDDNLQLLCPTCHTYLHFLSHTGKFRSMLPK